MPPCLPRPYGTGSDASACGLCSKVSSMRSSRRSALAIGKQLIGVNIQESIETVETAACAWTGTAPTLFLRYKRLRTLSSGLQPHP